MTQLAPSGHNRVHLASRVSLGERALVLVLAAISLITDFDSIERGVKAGVPAQYSWAAAFGLAVTLIWLYVEIVRILAILRGSD